MDKAKVLIVIVLIFSIASVSNALNIVYVDVSGPNNPGTGSFDDPFRKIKDAIDDANDGDIIEIRPGVYTGEGNYDLDPNGKSVTIRSIAPEDPNIVANTTIDPNEAGRGFYFDSGEDANCVVSGLTIRNGYTDGSGGALYCNNSSPVISHCVIIDNTAVWGGGGIYCYDSNLTLSNCVIAGNTTNSNGGGIKYFWCSEPILRNCTISSNEANWRGSGIYCYNSNAIITNCILWSNGLEEMYIEGSSELVTYCDIQGGWVDGSGNVNREPYFVSFDPNDDPNTWDFHLQSAYGRWNPDSQEWVADSNTSGCIDTGDPNSDWSNEPWPNGKRINMGAYGGTNQASMNGNPADFDISGAVNFVDFAEFCNKWLAEEACIEDLTGNGVVDFADLLIFAENWLWRRE